MIDHTELAYRRGAHQCLAMFRDWHIAHASVDMRAAASDLEDILEEFRFTDGAVEHLMHKALERLSAKYGGAK